MRCDDLDAIIEAIADGQTPAGEHDAHLASCARCQARVAMAQALDRLLAAGVV